MDIRLGKKNDLDGIKDLWNYCFEDGPSYVDFYFLKKFKEKNTMVLEDKGKILSAIHLNQFKLDLNGRDFPTSYIVGVSTLPEARGIGLMNSLLIKSLYEIRNRNQNFSILMPIDFRLYTRFGFQNCYDIMSTSLDIFSLKKFKIYGSFSPASFDTALELKEIYDEFNQNTNGNIYRSVDYFKDFIDEMSSEGGYTYINYRDSIPVGYLAYSINKGVFSVREIYYKDIISYKSMLKFIFNHNTQCKKVEMIEDVDTPIFHLLDNPKDVRFEKKPFMMARIVNFEKMIGDLDIEVNPKTYLYDTYFIKLIDNDIRENDGWFCLELESGSLKARKLNEVESKEVEKSYIRNTESDDIKDERILGKISIALMTSAIFSYQSFRDIVRIDEEVDHDIEKLDDILNIEKKLNHINEYV